MYRITLAAVSLIASPVSAQQSGSTGQSIVVTGQSIEQTQLALQACLDRSCPPAEEIAATLAHAENQFVAGDYKDARTTLIAGTRRNKQHAGQFPVEVAGLFRANSRVAAHLGEGQSARSAAFETLDALRAGLPDKDARVLVARAELADHEARWGRYDFAEKSYRNVARDASRTGHPIVEGFALLRIANMLTVLSERDPLYVDPARRAHAALASSTKPEHLPFVMASKVNSARLAAKTGDDSAIDRLLADFRAKAPMVRPVLLHSEPIKFPDLNHGSPVDARSGEEAVAQGNILNRLATRNFDDRWIDLGFWIAPDGRPTDVAVLRSSEKTENDWIDAITKSVHSRRYAPLKVDPNEPGIFRVERYTFTSRWTDMSGSRMRTRERQPRIEVLDLSTHDEVAQLQTSALPRR
jgi:hypothetical protein